MGRHLSDKSIDVLKAIKKLRWELSQIADAESIYQQCEVALDMADVRKCLGDLVRRNWLAKVGETYRFTDKAFTRWAEEIGEAFHPDDEPEEFVHVAEESHPLDEFTKSIHTAAERLKHLFEPRPEISEVDKAEIDAMLAFVETVAKAAHVEHHTRAIALVRSLIA